MPDEEKRAFQSATIGLPPLKMVLVHAENERQNESAKTILETPEAIEKRKKKKAIAKLIEHLNEQE